jgi:hypothetical protein
MRAIACLLVGVLGCQGGGNETPAQTPPKQGSAEPVQPGFGHHDAAEAPPEPERDGGAAPDDPEQVDVGKAIAELGAIPAWQAVVDRAQYLARRAQHGVVFGTVGPAILMPGPTDAGLVPSPYVWLVDDTEGNGSLAIRVALGANADKVKQGDRIALGGAWALDDAHVWFWKAEHMSPLPPASPPTTKDAPSQLGHTIANADLPAGTRPISKAGDGDLVYFQVVGAPPLIDGDGWPVADELGNPVVALLNMPGEAPSYGAQDMRTTDERWHLKRGVTYVVRVGIVHHHGPDKPATIKARTAPIKV